MNRRLTSSITDQDIEEMLMDAHDQIEMNGIYDIDGDDFFALLARLEAAEKAVESADGCDKGEVDSCQMRLDIKEWRKAAGK